MRLLRDREAQHVADCRSVSRRARGAMDEGRLAAQQVRIRRESVADSWRPPVSNWPNCSRGWRRCDRCDWETQLEETKGKIDRLGQ